MKKENMQRLVLALYDTMKKASVENSFPGVKDDCDFEEMQKKTVLTPDGQRHVVSFLLVTVSEDLRDAFVELLLEASQKVAKAVGSEGATMVVAPKARLYMGSEHVGDLEP